MYPSWIRGDYCNTILIETQVNQPWLHFKITSRAFPKTPRPSLYQACSAKPPGNSFTARNIISKSLQLIAVQPKLKPALTVLQGGQSKCKIYTTYTHITKAMSSPLPLSSPTGLKPLLPLSEKRGKAWIFQRICTF